MSRALRIVQVSGFPVLPPWAGGKIRIVQLARAMCALGVDVTIVAPFHVTQRRALAEREPFTLLEVPYPFLIPLLFTNLPFPYGALASFHPGYRALLPVSLETFDVCQLEHPAFVDLVRDVPRSVPVVYDAQNVEFDYVCAESPTAAVRRLAGARVRALEARLVERSAHVFACSEADLRRLSELYGAFGGGGSVLPNGVDLAAVDARRERLAGARQLVPARLPRRAIFAGSAVTHNHEAVEALLSRVAPLLEDEVEFVIVGSCARRFRRKRRSNVVLDPEGDVARYAGPTTVGLNPVVQGSGTSLKLLDYLAHDVPVLSTPHGLRGFEELAPWVVTADLDAFPDVLSRELSMPDGVREKLSTYEWHRIAEQALCVYEALTGRDGPDAERRDAPS